jgi:hypothetical protein
MVMHVLFAFSLTLSLSALETQCKQGSKEDSGLAELDRL